MPNHGSSKRSKELARQERQRQKLASRLERKKEKDAKRGDDADGDPDLAGIVAGPQPPLDADAPPEE